MARRSHVRVSRPSNRGRTRPARAPWLSPETRSELRGITFGLLGLATLLSLIALPERGNLIGPLGDLLEGALTVAVGRPVALCVPALLLWWAWLAFRGRRPQHSWVTGGGAILLILSVCALLGLPRREMDQYAFMDWVGVLGTFLVYDAPRSLNLPRLLGVAGTTILFTGLGMAGLLLATDLLYTNVASRTAVVLRGVWIVTWGGTKVLGRELIDWTLGPWLHRGEEDEEEDERRRPREVIVPKPTPRVLNPAALPVLGPEPVSAPKPEPLILDHDDPMAARAMLGEPAPEPVSVPRPKKRKPTPALEAEQPELNLSGPYELPPLSLLNPSLKTEHKMSHDQIREISATLERTLADFSIEATVTQVTQGPVITRFELRPAAGVKITKIVSLQSDIAMALRAHAVRIQAPIPGKAAVGIEVPNPKPNVVPFHDIATSGEFQNEEAPLAFILGKTIAGEPKICNLAAMPHLLIAGATGSGKSVCLNSIIASILLRQTPDRVKFLMIDPKRVELSIYDAIPHLIAPVVTDSRRAPAALAWMVEHMEERYRTLAEVGVRNIDAHNALVGDRDAQERLQSINLKPMPHIVVIIDELADLMMVAKADVEENVQRIAQMARAVGIHLIIATQRPSVNVITGVIKANLPARIAFKVSQKVDSRVIIDGMGAEALLGRGDMLYSTGSAGGPMRLQGAYIDDDETERIADHVRDQERAKYLKTEFHVKRSKGKMDGDEAIDAFEDSGDEFSMGSDAYRDEPMDDELSRQATVLILQSRKASVSLLQRRMKIGFARAGRLMDMLEQQGIVGPYRGSKPREILVDPAAHLAKMRANRGGVAVREEVEEGDEDE